MIPTRWLTTWILVSMAAAAVLYGAAVAILTPLIVLVIACPPMADPRPRHELAHRTPATVTVLRLRPPGTGSMDLGAELAWRHRYQIPPGLPVTSMESGSGPPPEWFRVPPFRDGPDYTGPSWGTHAMGACYLAAECAWCDLEAERMATGADLVHAAELELADADAAAYMTEAARRWAEIRAAALAGLQ